ncbi:hypothetical protein Pelo_12352 [Pelomyxa schiedti]|nr:hypothetical protein Pelo_12352 [Pelomyxa schiedti]
MSGGASGRKSVFDGIDLSCDFNTWLARNQAPSSSSARPGKGSTTASTGALGVNNGEQQREQQQAPPRAEGDASDYDDDDDDEEEATHHSHSHGGDGDGEEEAAAGGGAADGEHEGGDGGVGGSGGGGGAGLGSDDHHHHQLGGSGSMQNRSTDYGEGGGEGGPAGGGGDGDGDCDGEGDGDGGSLGGEGVGVVGGLGTGEFSGDGDGEAGGGCDGDAAVNNVHQEDDGLGLVSPLASNEVGNDNGHGHGTGTGTGNASDLVGLGEGLTSTEVFTVVDAKIPSGDEETLDPLQATNESLPPSPNFPVKASHLPNVSLNPSSKTSNDSSNKSSPSNTGPTKISCTPAISSLESPNNNSFISKPVQSPMSTHIEDAQGTRKLNRGDVNIGIPKLAESLTTSLSLEGYQKKGSSLIGDSKNLSVTTELPKTSTKKLSSVSILSAPNSLKTTSRQDSDLISEMAKQEELISGYQKENERLCVKLKEMQEEARAVSEQHQLEKQKMQNELNTVKETSLTKVASMKLAEEETQTSAARARSEMQEAKALSTSLQAELVKLRRQLSAVGVSHTNTTEFTPRENELAKLKEQQAEHQKEVETLKSKISIHEETIAHNAHTISSQSQRIVHMEAQIKEYQETIKRQARLSAITPRNATVDAECILKLRQEAAVLKDKLTNKDLEFDRKLKTLRLEQDKVKNSYEFRIRTLNTQLHELETSKAKVTELEGQLNSVRSYYRVKMEALQKQIQANSAPVQNMHPPPNPTSSRVAMCSRGTQTHFSTLTEPASTIKRVPENLSMVETTQPFTGPNQELVEEITKLKSELKARESAVTVAQQKANEAIRQAQQEAYDKIAELKAEHRKQILKSAGSTEQDPDEVERLQDSIAALSAKLKEAEQQYVNINRELKKQAVALQASISHSSILSAECKELREALIQANSSCKIATEQNQQLQQALAEEKAEVAHLQSLKEEWSLELATFAGQDTAETWQHYEAVITEKNRQIAAFQTELSSLLQALEILQQQNSNC